MVPFHMGTCVCPGYGMGWQLPLPRAFVSQEWGGGACVGGVQGE